MNITTNYEIGDTVYFIKYGVVQASTILAISIDIDANKTSIWYRVDDADDAECTECAEPGGKLLVYKQRMFKSKKELIESL